MRYTHLGRTGLRVSRICLGTMNFGPETDEPTSFAIMDSALDAGINFFDSANVYGRSKGRGATEEIVGRWFAQGGGRREKVVIATKLYGDMGEWPNEGRLSALNIRRACDASLKRLQTDYIDLYQMHHIDRHTGWDEIWEAMEVLRTQGKILYVGSSNFAGWHIAQAQEAAARRNFMGLVSEQSIYNLIVRNIEREVLPAAETYGLGVIPWSPLQGGLLGGVVRKERDGSRRYAGRAAETIEARRPQLEAYEDLCAEIGEEPGHGRAGLAADPAGGDRADRRAADARAPRLGPARRRRDARRQGAGPPGRALPRATRRRPRTTPGRRSLGRARRSSRCPEGLSDPASSGWASGPGSSGAWAARSSASTESLGRIRSSQAGNHQLALPNIIMMEGTMAIRMRTASTRMPPARPMPNSLMTRFPPRMNEPKTRIMISAAAVIVLPVAARPLRTATRLSPPDLMYSSCIRDTRKTW